MSNENPQMANGENGSWTFPILLFVMLVVLVGLAKWGADPRPLSPAQTVTSGWTPSPQPTGETIRLEIDFGNGAKKQFATLPWQQDMTVADVLQSAQNYRPGITFTQSGQGESGFLKTLDGLGNQGASGKNWLYTVDGKHATMSFCLKKIEAGAHILWRFTDEQYNGDPAE